MQVRLATARESPSLTTKALLKHLLIELGQLNMTIRSLGRNPSTIRVSSSDPVLQNVGISPPDQSGPSNPPITATQGGQFRAWYWIFNPDSQPVTIILGLSIRDTAGILTSDPANDAPCILDAQRTVICNRFFNIPSNLAMGSYDVGYGVWKSDMSAQYAETWNSGWLSIRTTFQLYLSSATTDGQRNVGTIEISTKGSFNLPATLALDQGTYGAYARPPAGYLFDRYEVTGGVTTTPRGGDPADVLISIEGDGGITAWFKNSPFFDISCAPTALAANPGGTVSATISVISRNGFDGNVNLKLGWSGDLRLLSYNFAPDTVYVPKDGNTASTLTVNLTSDASPKTYQINVIGESGLLTKSIDIPFTVGSSKLVVFPIEPSQGAVVTTLPVTLKVQVTTGGPTSSVEGAQVSFLLDGGTVGSATSDYQGYASVSVPSISSGRHSWVASASREGYESGGSPIQDFNYNPVGPTRLLAQIDSISPNPAEQGQAVSFSGHGIDGYITEYSWTSSIDGYLSDSQTFSMSSLSAGVHTIFFKVKDNNGVWSDDATATLQITPPQSKQTPTAQIDSISPNPTEQEQVVSFSGHGLDPDGYITEYGWRSSIDGQLSNSQTFSTSSLSAGTHTIFFKVKDNDGLWSQDATANLEVTSAQSTTEGLRVRVLDSQTRQPLAGVGVFVDSSYRGDTDSSGAILLVELPYGRRIVECRMDGYRTTTNVGYVQPGRVDEIEVHMVHEVEGQAVCPFSIIEISETSILIRLCAEKVQEIMLGKSQRTPCLFGYTCALGVVVLVMIDAFKEYVGGQLDPDLADILLRLYAIVNEVLKDPDKVAAIVAAVGLELVDLVESLAIDLLVDLFWAAGVVWMSVKYGDRHGILNSDGSMDIDMPWFSQQLSKCLEALGRLYAELAKASLDYLLKEASVELPNTSIVGLVDPGHKLYLHVYDQQGRHVGFNPTTQTVEIQIPDAQYFEFKQTTLIFVPPEITSLRAVVDGSEATEASEQYALATLVSRENGSVGSSKIETPSIEKGKANDHSIEISSDGTEVVVESNQPASSSQNEILLGSTAALAMTVAVLIYATRSRRRRQGKSSHPRVKEIRTTANKPLIKSIQETGAKPRVLKVEEE